MNGLDLFLHYLNNCTHFYYSLCRIAELEEDNKMSPSNLGIVFGPSLIRPRPSGATVSLSSLVDYPYQARVVETLIVFYPIVFPSELNRPGGISTVHAPSLQQVCAISPTHSCNKSVCHCYYWAVILKTVL